jgi:hypothetical protein
MRAGAGLSVDAAKLLRLMAWLLVAALVAMAADLSVSAASQNSRLRLLQTKGVEVQARVTSCTGYGSGVGMSVVYYRCSVTYSLDGRQYSEVLGGSRQDLPVGATVEAVAVPSQPTLVASRSSVRTSMTSFAPYVTPLVLGIVAAVMVMGLVASARRSRRRVSP